MKKHILSFLCVTLFIGSFLIAQESTVQKITQTSDLPEAFCSAFEEGDYLISDGKYLVLIGGTSRNLQSVLNYPAGDAMGSIIGFVPAGKNLKGNLLAGTPVVWIGEERQEITYDSIKPVSVGGAEGAMVIEADALFEGKKGERAQISTRYRFFSRPGTIEIKSNIKNTGKSRIEDLSFPCISMPCTGIPSALFTGRNILP